MMSVPFITKKLEIDFVSAELCKQSGDDALQILGAATIYSEEDQLWLKFYCEAGTSPDCEIRGIRGGKIIPKSELFRFTGGDLSGREWSVENIVIDGGVWNRSLGRVIQTRIDVLSTPEEKEQIYGARYYYKQKYKIPLNTYHVDDDRLHLRGLELCVGNIEVRIKQQLNYTVVDIVSECKRERQYDELILQALSIASGCNFTKYSYVEGSNKYISNHKRYSRNRLPSPFKMMWSDREYEEFINCYVGYYAANMSEVGNEGDVAFDQWTLLHETQNSLIEVESVVAAIGVEAILNCYFKKHVAHPDSFIEKLEKEKLEIEKREQDKEISDLYKGALDFGKLVSPRIMLEILKGKAISKSNIWKWKNLRDQSAHGKPLDWHLGDPQKTLDAYRSCLHLFYCLVFFVVGYRGRYLNCSKYGTPEARFSEVFETNSGELTDIPLEEVESNEA